MIQSISNAQATNTKVEYIYINSKYNTENLKKIQSELANVHVIKKQNFKTFHQKIKFFLLIGQCFAILPVYGILAKSASSLKFVLWSLKVFYTFCILCLFLLVTMFNMYSMGQSDVKMDKMIPLVWIINNTLSLTAFAVLARHWAEVMQYWEGIEMNVAIVSPKYDKKLKLHILLSTIGILLLALIEHLLSIANGVHYGIKCVKTSSVVEAFFRQEYPGFFSVFEYNIFSGLIIQTLTIYLTFLWNYTDSFIILLSLGLAAQFQHFNEQIEAYKGKSLPNDFWGEQREYYNNLTRLVALVDKRISPITILSFSNNLALICVQLFKSFSGNDNLISSIYFWYSLSFLIGRTLLISLSAAKIHDESQKPADVLRLIPIGAYLVEPSRFLEQVTNSVVALSGKHYFHITRSFILTVAGTVITYELVLVQLQMETEVSGDPCLS